MLDSARGFVLLALLGVLAIAAGCGGGDDGDPADTGEAAAALPLEQRVLRSRDLPGAEAGAVTTWADAGEFARAFRVFDPGQLTDRLEEAGFEEAVGVELAYQEGGRSVQSVAVRLDSPEDAADQVAWLYESASAPCPPGCGVRADELPLDGVPGGRAVEVSADRATQLGPPFESRFAVFADGPFLYMAFAFGRPQATPSGEFADAVSALHRRVEGRPPADD